MRLLRWSAAYRCIHSCSSESAIALSNLFGFDLLSSDYVSSKSQVRRYCPPRHSDKLPYSTSIDTRQSHNHVSQRLAKRQQSQLSSAERWTRTLEKHLPPAAQSSATYEGNDSQSQSGNQARRSVPRRLLAVLLDARKMGQNSLLCDLGARHGRWDAVLWTVEQITAAAAGPGSFTYHRRAIGEVLRSLGDMIIQLADQPSAQAKETMSHILQIIARLHQINALPSNLYRQPTRAHGATLYRPPTLHLWSSRILASLSDAVWDARGARATAEVNTSGRLDTPSNSRVRQEFKLNSVELSPEIWMEFILWACVQGEFTLEGAMILQQLEKRGLAAGVWVFSDSEVLQHASAAGLSALGKAGQPSKSYKRASRQSYGRLGIRAISLEVVKALIDRLVENLEFSGLRHAPSLESILGHVLSLVRLISRDGRRLEDAWWSQIMSRITDAVGTGSASDVDLRMFLHLNTETGSIHQIPFRRENQLPLERSHLPYHDLAQAVQDQILHNFQVAAHAGDITRAQHLLKSAQALREAWGLETPRSQLYESRAQARGGSHDSSSGTISDTTMTLRPRTWNRVLATFVGLVVQSEQLVFSRSLLSQKSSGKPLISQDSYTDPELLPALIRFASVLDHKDLVATLESRLRPPLDVDILRALLECQVRLSRWDRAKKLLEMMREDTRASWYARLAMVLARYILERKRMEELRGRHVSVDDLAKASNLLAELLNGDHGPPETERLTSTAEQHRYVEALRRIISTASEDLSWVNTGRKPSESLPEGEINTIPVEAFNALLFGVVRRHGSAQGIRLWNQSCADVSPNQHDGDRIQIKMKPPWIRRTESLMVESSSSGPGDSTSRKSNVNQTVFPLPTVKPSLVTPNLISLDMISLGAIRRYKIIMSQATTTQVAQEQQEQQQKPKSPPIRSTRRHDEWMAEKLELQRVIAWVQRKQREFGVRAEKSMNTNDHNDYLSVVLSSLKRGDGRVERRRRRRRRQRRTRTHEAKKRAPRRVVGHRQR